MKTKSRNPVVRAVVSYFRANWGILLAFVAMCLIFSIFGNNFLTTNNMVNLLRTCATNCYLAIGVQMAIILAGIDLTGGALAGFLTAGRCCLSVFQLWKISGNAHPCGCAAGHRHRRPSWVPSTAPWWPTPASIPSWSPWPCSPSAVAPLTCWPTAPRLPPPTAASPPWAPDTWGPSRCLWFIWQSSSSSISCC